MLSKPSTPRVTYLKQVFDRPLANTLIMIALVGSFFLVPLFIDREDGRTAVRWVLVGIMAVMWLLPWLLKEFRDQRAASKAEWDAYENQLP